MKKFWVVVNPFSAGHGLEDCMMETDAIRYARYISSVDLADYERSRPEVHQTREDALADLSLRAGRLEEQARRLRVESGGKDTSQDVLHAWTHLLSLVSLPEVISMVRQEIEASDFGSHVAREIVRENEALQREIAKVS